jgi:myosin heavy subunit
MPPKAAKKVDTANMKIPVWAKAGKAIWVEIMDENDIIPLDYIKGRIDQIFEETKKISILYEEVTGEKEVYANRILERAEEPQVLEDLVDIDPLNDAELLRCLELRFKKDDLYCFCGPTLLATNPYKPVKGLTLPEHRELFKKFALTGGKKITMPHIWNISSRAFWQLFDNNTKQAMCISGESGAGKTFGTKLAMAFITGLFDGEEGEKTEGIPIEDKILNCNPIMEGFGNAKTVRNDNSSRFGKYFIMYVDRSDKHIKGAEIRNYLLEKSRVIIQAVTERNYHVFYGVLRFMDKERLKKYHFCNDGDNVKMESFNYLLKSKCFIWETINDLEFFTDISNSFNSLGFDAEEQEAVWKTLSCVLNLGNVDIDASTYKEGDVACQMKEGPYMEKVCALLNIAKDSLVEGCTMIKREIQGQIISSPRSPAQAEGIRDALGKDLFNNTFNWIVRKLNLTLLPNNPSQYTSIGLLDIFGFEDFDINSIEQFCINYTNEKLQNLYISYVFKAEKVCFEEEGLGAFLSMIKFVDNIPIIELLDKKPAGVFHLIDSVGKVAKDDGKDDAKFVDQLRNTYENKNPFILFHKMKKEVFMIKHTAKDVWYWTPGFVDKNKDELPKNLLDSLQVCDRVMMRIFNRKLTDDEELKEKVNDPMEKFLGYKFRNEMQSLMDELLSCECAFVRCIKPNEIKKKDFWVPALALNQIRYLGILDSINVRRNSLPVRKMYEEFYSKYQDIDKFSPERNTSYIQLKDKPQDWKKMAENVVKSSQETKPQDDEVLFGKNKIFMSVPLHDQTRGDSGRKTKG